MRFALDERGNYQSAELARQFKKTKFFCPLCRQTLRFKLSKLGRAFFAHKRPCQSAAAHNISWQNQGESQTHQSFKTYFVHYFLNRGLEAKSEVYYPSIQQFADVELTYKGQQWIIEFQKSPISACQLHQRHQAYLSKVQTVYWILDQSRWKDRHSQFTKSMIHFASGLGYYRLWWDGQSAKLSLELLGKYGLQNKNTKSSLVPLPLFYLLDLASFPIKKKRESFKVSLDRSQVVQRKLQTILHSPVYRPYLNDFYQMGLCLSQVPAWVWLAPQPIFIDSPSWLYWTWIHLGLQAMGLPSLIHRLPQYLSLIEKRDHLKFSHLPFVGQDSKKALIKATQFYLHRIAVDK